MGEIYHQLELILHHLHFCFKSPNFLFENNLLK